MLESILFCTCMLKHTRVRTSSSMFLRYKNEQKFRPLLNAMRINTRRRPT